MSKVSIPTPKGLTRPGLGYWRRIKRTMEEQGGLDFSDEYVLLLAAQTYEEYLQARADVKKNGITMKTKSDRNADIVKTNPAAAVMNQASTRLLKILDKMGLTPNSRNRGKGGGSQGDPIGDLLND